MTSTLAYDDAADLSNLYAKYKFNIKDSINARKFKVWKVVTFKLFGE